MNAHKFHTYTLSLGTNMPDGPNRLNEGVRFLATILDKIVCSQIYTTPDVSHPESAPYTNMVICGISDTEPDSLNILLKDYEKRCGRRHDCREVVIDIDIVICDENILRPRDYKQSYFTIGYNQINNI